MQWICALAPALVAGCMVVVSLSATAQPAPAAAKRQKVDVRPMVPGMQASDAAAEPRPAASGLTREQRKEATLQARQEGALQPAGEGADQRLDKPAALAGSTPTPPTATTELAPTPAPAVVAEATRPTVMATAPPAATKKNTRKKARVPAASAPG